MRRPIAIVGPTATGKSELAVRLAQALGDGEVVNADAMQLYRGMDIGTAKLTTDERGGVAHHLLDVLDVTETASVAAYQRQARAAIEHIRGRGATPILAGGSGLYVAAVLDDLDFPGTDAAVRAWRPSWPGWVRRSCTAGWPMPTRRRPPGSCRATGGGSSARWRCSPSPAVRSARSCRPGALPGARPC